MPEQSSSPTRREASAFLSRQIRTTEKNALWLCVSLRVMVGVLSVVQAWALLWSVQGFLNLPLLSETIGAGVSPWARVGVFLALVLARGGLAKMADVWGAEMSARFRVELRQALYQRFLALGPIHLARLGDTGALTTALVDEVEALDGFVARYLPLQYAASIVPFLVAAVVFFLAPWAGAVLLGAGVLLPLLLAVLGIYAAKASQSQFSSLRRLSGTFFDKLSHMPLLRAYGAEDMAAELLASQADHLRKRTMAVLRRAFLSTIALEFVSLISFAVIAGLVVSQGTFSLPSLMVILLVPEFFAPLRALSASYHDRAVALGAAPHLMQLLAAPLPQSSQAQKSQSVALSHAPSLRLKNISYTYPSRVFPALQKVSLSFEAGCLTALVGESGAGKTTLLHLMAGFLAPDQGEILAHDAPLNASLVGWLGQKAYLFHGSVRSNLTMGDNTFSDADLWRALDLVGLKDMVLALADGLDGFVGARGYGLSGGQARRLALARVLLRKPLVLLLDEPTAGLDASSARDVVEALKKATAGRTVVMVSHDPVALALADKTCSLSSSEVSHA